jgi:aspartyl-tRNA(Asn)/glutamyl-tRNA(Gln) amidotransferase subunit C
MKISREDVIRVAELAHLGLSPEEIETYRGQLDGILSYIDKLRELNITDVEPMAQVICAPTTDGGASHDPGLREDVVRPCEVGEPILSSAPNAAKPFFRVPRVIDR